jgi:hypothetical protein
MLIWALRMRMLTTVLLECSNMPIEAGGEHNDADSDELLRRGTVKFSWMRLPLDAILHQDDPGDKALLPDYSLELGVLAIDGGLQSSNENIR